jgi:hypothetical protein
MFCPECQKKLEFLCSWTFRGLWGYSEVRTYECSTHGPVFVGLEASIVRDPDKSQEPRPNHGDRDSVILVPRKPTSPLDADATAIPEPDSD